MQYPLVSERTIATAFGWFFASLLMFATLSQPGASQDEWQHLASSWCGRGERAPYCTDVRDNDGTRSATINFTVVNCSPAPDSPISCPAIENVASRQQISTEGPLRAYYFVTSWLVSSSIEQSVFLMRTMNAMFAATLLAALAWLLPQRHRAVLIVTMLATLNVSGYFLLASLNPTSWMILGAGLGWLPFHASLSKSDLSERRRRALVALGTLFTAMSLSSGYLAGYSLAVAGVLLCVDRVQSSHLLLRTRRARAPLLAAVFAGVALWMIFRVPPDEALLALPRVLQGFATIPSSSHIRLPITSLILALLLIVLLFVVTYNSASRRQFIGAVSAIWVSSLVIVRFSPTNEQGFRSIADEIGSLSIDARLSVPLIVVAASWWFLHGPQNLLHSIREHLRLIFGMTLAVFALTAFSIVERFTDRQTFGLRVVPDGPDQWWWHWLPVPPSVTMVLSMVFMWRFLLGVRGIFGEPVRIDEASCRPAQ